MKLISSKDAFFAAAQPAREEVEIRDGKKILVTELGADEFLGLWWSPQFAGEQEGTVNLAKFIPALVARCVIDKNGSRILDDSDIEQLGKTSRDIYGRLAEVARRLNGLGVKEKNSEASLEGD
jgi:hypothetical protein